MTDRPVRAARAEPRDIVELRQLKVDQPELAAAVDMQIALVEARRRVQARVPLPWIQVDPEWLRTQQAAGRPLVRFREIPLAWTDFRLAFRQTADILHRFDSLERADYNAIVALGREGHVLEPLVTAWYDATSGVEATPDADARQRALGAAPPSVEHVLLLAIRPFLARCAEALGQRLDLSTWKHGHCPFCGWECEFAVVMPTGERRLVCGRYLAQWPFAPWTCPYCANDDRTLVTSFATRDGRYRVYACDVCRRYLKAYDARNAPRPLLIAVDSIATLPLDAAAMQRGYQ